MKIEKAEKRQEKNRKARQGMRISNKSIFVVVATIGRKAEKLNKKKGKK